MNDEQAYEELEKFKNGAFWKSVVKAVKQSIAEAYQALNLDSQKKEVADLDAQDLLDRLVAHYVKLGDVAHKLSYHEELEKYRKFEQEVTADKYGWRNVLKDLTKDLINKSRKYL